MTTPLIQQGGEALPLVAMHGDRPVTTSLIIADGVGIQHKNALGSIRGHLPDFEEFGPVAFETRKGQPLPQGGFGKSTEVALLNEEQAALLISYSRNTEVVRAFKVALIKAFKAMRDRLVPVQALTPAQMLLAQAQALVDHEQQIAALAARTDTLAAKVEDMQRLHNEAKESLEALPGPKADVPVLSTRTLVNRVVRDYCFATGFDHRSAWRRLYMEFRDRHRVDLLARAEHAAVKPLEIAEREGHIENLYSLALYLFRQPA